MTRTVLVTDHAVVRYLERVKGMDVEAVRAEIGETVRRAVEAGASAFTHGGMRYCLDESGAVKTIVNVRSDPLWSGRDDDRVDHPARLTPAGRKRQRAELRELVKLHRDGYRADLDEDSTLDPAEQDIIDTIELEMAEGHQRQMIDDLESECDP